MVNHTERSAKSYLLPVVIAIAAYCGLNALWNHPQVNLYQIIPQSLGVYLVGGSGVSLLLLWRAARAGLITRREVGLDVRGWSPGKRLIGIAMILTVAIGGYVTIPPPPLPESAAAVDDTSTTLQEEAAPRPEKSVVDYAFWFVFLLAASLSELLVFVSIAFCLPERWLKQCGMPAIPATVVAALFAAFAFGLYHFTYEPRWWAYAIMPLVPVMLINLAYFTITRNFWLTLVLHNAFASMGFTTEQYATTPPDRLMNPQTYLSVVELTPVLAAFVIPVLFLHWLEAKAWPPASDATPIGGRPAA